MIVLGTSIYPRCASMISVPHVAEFGVVVSVTSRMGFYDGQYRRSRSDPAGLYVVALQYLWCVVS